MVNRIRQTKNSCRSKKIILKPNPILNQHMLKAKHNRILSKVITLDVQTSKKAIVNASNHVVFSLLESCYLYQCSPCWYILLYIRQKMLPILKVTGLLHLPLSVSLHQWWHIIVNGGILLLFTAQKFQCASIFVLFQYFGVLGFLNLLMIGKIMRRLTSKPDGSYSN